MRRAIYAAIPGYWADNRSVQSLAFISLASLAFLLAYAREWGCDRGTYRIAWAGAALAAFWFGCLI